MQKKQRQAVTYIALFAVSLAFYLLWYFIDGVILTEDAPSYINMQSDREPGYCLYLLLFRTVFGAKAGIHAAVIGQCVIAALAACAITVGLTKLFSLGRLGGAGILAIQYGMTLLNRFVAQRRYSYYNSIETEGLAYSLWVFYFLCILGILYRKDKKSLIGAVVWSMVLISIRKQMLITLVILLAVVFVSYCKRIGWKKAVLCVVAIVCLTLGSTRLIDCTYNFALRGVFAVHTGDAGFILGNELYVATGAETIRDDTNRAIFHEILRRCNENEYNTQYAGEGWYEFQEHYSMSYDRIKFDIVMPVIRESQDVRGIPDAAREEDYNRIVSAMMQELLLPCLPRLVKLYFANIVHGFVTTVLKAHPLFNWIAFLVYLLYGATMILLYQTGKMNTAQNAANPLCFALLVLFAIAVNVCFTSLTIYCQMRYMLYNTGLFYQAWWVMLITVFQMTGIGQRKGNGKKICRHGNKYEGVE